jgi:hypothetical protein
LPRANGSGGLTVTAARIRHEGRLTVYVASPNARNTDLFIEGEFANCLKRPTIDRNAGMVIAFDFGMRCKKPVPPFLTTVVVSGLTSVFASVPLSQDDRRASSPLVPK